MQSTFSGIEIGKRSLITHTQGLNTIGHNLSNASTEGYSRQRVELKPFDPIYMPGLNREETPGQLGQGVMVERIERIRDEILEGRIVSKANGQGFWEARDKYILMVEQIYNEPTEHSLRTLMDRFWESWQELAMNPSQLATRTAVLQRGQSMIEGIHERYSALQDIRGMLELDITVSVERVNTILQDVADLNQQIVKIKAMGDNPNDLLDRRDLLVKELSSLVDITVDNRDSDEFLIHTGGLHLLQGKNVHPLIAEPNPQNDGYSRIIWSQNNEEAFFRGGRLAALLEMRDGDVREEIQKLDMMTINFVDLVNEIHRSGFGLNGTTRTDFFTEYPFINNLAGNYDRDGDGVYDSSYIFRITGNNSLNPQEQIGLRGTITLSGQTNNVLVDYFPTDTIEDIIGKINNSGAEVAARLDRNGQLLLKGTPAYETGNPDFVIRHIEDSGQFLAGYAGVLLQSGPEGAFSWESPDAILSLRSGGDFAVAPLSHPAGWIEVNPELFKDPNGIAAGFGENGREALTGDGRAALAVAQLRNSQVMIGKATSFDEFFSDAVANIGLKGEIANRTFETENLIMKELEDMRASISGVNVDEEFAQLIKFQHGYNAAARFISEITQMIDTIINRMGV